ncbi:MAG: glycosyltransferase family 9 protein [Labilithrix sp.]|nr:glycosyltransferase family 9 protein [Labilithrix sp.]MCW5810325.1 glycosyltransferase family 9 protein [Labilithrix sp.]
MLDVKMMRKVDAVVGNAICSALAVGKRLKRPFMQPVTAYKKICVMKFFGMGSIVVATPSLRALRDQFPGAEIHFVTFKGNKELLEILGLTDKHYFVDNSSPQAFVASTLKVARDLRAAGCDLVIDLEFYAKFPLVLASLGNIPQKAGFYLNPEPWRRELLDVPGWYNHYFHTKDIFLSLVYLLAKDDFYYLEFAEFAAKYTYPRVSPAEASLAAVWSKLAAHGVGKNGRVFVINPNTSPELAPEARKWPAERYGELARLLLAEYPEACVAFIGTKGEAAYVEAVARTTRDPRAFSMAGELNLRELLALFSITDVLVSNDSGPMHLACLVDTPTVGLFFADTPTLFAPIGSRVASIAPNLYSMPLFTVYNGKDVVVGRKSEAVRNTAACTVSVKEVFERTRPVISPAPRAAAVMN